MPRVHTFGLDQAVDYRYQSAYHDLKTTSDLENNTSASVPDDTNFGRGMAVGDNISVVRAWDAVYFFQFNSETQHWDFLEQHNSEDFSQIDSFTNVDITWDAEIVVFGDQHGGSSGNGAVHIFNRQTDLTTWNYVTTVFASDLSLDSPQNFGDTVKISSDGSTMAVRDDRAGSNEYGAVSILTTGTADGSAWTLEEEFVFQDASHGYVDVSNYGRVVTFSGKLADGYDTYVYRYDGTSWQKELETQQFSAQVTVSGDASLIAIGYMNGGSDSNGEVSLWTYDGSSWSKASTIEAFDADIENVGSSVSLNDDGTRLIVGDYNAGSTDEGGVYKFKLNGTNWELEEKLLIEDYEPDKTVDFGRSSDISPSGAHAAGGIGGDIDNTEGLIFLFGYTAPSIDGEPVHAVYA